MWEPFLANTDIFTLPTTLGSSPRDRSGHSRPCKLWSFSIHLLADFLFSHALDGSKLLILKSCPKHLPCSPGLDILPTSHQLHSGLCFRGAGLLIIGTPRCTLHSGTQHLCSDSFQPLFFPTYAPFLLLPRFPDALNLESVPIVPLLCPFPPLQNPQEGICSSPMAWPSRL